VDTCADLDSSRQGPAEQRAAVDRDAFVIHAAPIEAQWQWQVCSGCRAMINPNVKLIIPVDYSVHPSLSFKKFIDFSHDSY